MARAIDADRLADGLKLHRQPTDQKHEADRQWAVGYNAGLDRALHSIAYAPTLTQPNEPLTLEQLREMDGQPVFLETGEVSIREQLIAEWEILTEHDDSCFYFTLRKRGFHIKDYGKTWIAYRHPPEGEEK